MILTKRLNHVYALHGIFKKKPLSVNTPFVHETKQSVPN